METLETAINYENIKINEESIKSKPVTLSYSMLSKEGFPLVFKNEWVLEYLPKSKTFCFHDGGHYYFDAENGNYLGEKKPRLNKTSKEYYKNSKPLKGEVINKFIQIYDTLLRSISDIGKKAKQKGYFSSDISNECAGFLGRMKSERINIELYLLENSFCEHESKVSWSKSPRAKSEDFEIYSGEVQEDMTYGILLKGKEFDKRRKKIIPLINFSEIKYNSEDVKTVLEKYLGESCNDVKAAQTLSPVSLEKILSTFRQKIKEEDRKNILKDKLIKIYSEKKEYEKELFSDNSSSTKAKKFGESYKLFQQKSALSLLKTLLVAEECRQVIDEKVTEKKTAVSVKGKNPKGPPLTAQQESFKDCVNELKERFKSMNKQE